MSEVPSVTKSELEDFPSDLLSSPSELVDFVPFIPRNNKHTSFATSNNYGLLSHFIVMVLES